MKHIYTHNIQKFLVLLMALTCCTLQTTSAMQTLREYTKKSYIIGASAALVGAEHITTIGIKSGIFKAAAYIAPRIVQETPRIVQEAPRIFHENSLIASIPLYAHALIASIPTLTASLMLGITAVIITNRIKIFGNIQQLLSNNCNKENNKTIIKTAESTQTFANIFHLYKKLPLMTKIPLRYAIPSIACISILLRPQKIIQKYMSHHQIDTTSHTAATL